MAIKKEKKRASSPFFTQANRRHVKKYGQLNMLQGMLLAAVIGICLWIMIIVTALGIYTFVEKHMYYGKADVEKQTAIGCQPGHSKLAGECYGYPKVGREANENNQVKTTPKSLTSEEGVMPSSSNGNNAHKRIIKIY